MIGPGLDRRRRSVRRRSARRCRAGSGGAGGQSTVELALVLPVLVMGALLVAQVARVAGDHLALQHAVREAARRAAIDPVASPVSQASTRAAPGLDPARLEVELHGGRSRGDLLTVRLRYVAPTDVPVVGRLVPDVELAATAVVRVE